MLKVEIDTSSVNRIDHDISPLMGVAITLPLRINGADPLQAIGDGYTVHVSKCAFADGHTYRIVDVTRAVLAQLNAAPDACLTHGETCEEADGFVPHEEYGAELAKCTRLATRIIYHQRPGERPYRMCDHHAEHNITNRGAIELVPKARP